MLSSCIDSLVSVSSLSVFPCSDVSPVSCLFCFVFQECRKCQGVIRQGELAVIAPRFGDVSSTPDTTLYKTAGDGC